MDFLDNLTINALSFLKDLLERKSPGEVIHSILGNILLSFLLAFPVSAIFYYRFVEKWNLPREVSTWIYSFDISIAHTLITVPLLFIYIVVVITALVILAVIISLPFILYSYEKRAKGGTNKSKAGYEIPSWLQAALSFLFLAWFILLFILVAKYLFYDNHFLQKFLFGAFDSSFGWNYPTTYRVSVIYLRLEQLLIRGMENSVVSSIGKLLLAVGTIVISIGAFLEAVERINKWLGQKR